MSREDIVVHLVAAFLSGGTIYVLTGDAYAGFVAMVIGAGWFFIGTIYGYDRAAEI